jgi:hypothetical protein
MKYMSDIKIIDYVGELSVRSAHGLLGEGCVTMQDAAKLSESFIKTRIPNIGRLSAEEIISFRKNMASMCYLTVEDRNANEIVVLDNTGGEIIISDFEQVTQLCADLMKIRDQKWGRTEGGEGEA